MRLTLLDLEVAQVVRRYVRGGEITLTDGTSAIDRLRRLDIERYAHEPFLERIWSLRANLTAYDASYVALAEALHAELLTCDRGLARAPGITARVTGLCDGGNDPEH